MSKQKQQGGSSTPTPAEVTTGDTYSFGGYDWVVAEQGNGYAVLQSTGVTHGAWAGYKLTSDYEGTTISFGKANTKYNNSIDGFNIANYDDKMIALYDSIKSLEYIGTSYGSGLFLVSNVKAGTTTPNTQGSGNYWTTLKIAATNYESFGAYYSGAWLGTDNDGYNAWYVNSSGNFGRNSDQNIDFVIAPAFNLDLSKVTVSGNTITIK